MFMVRMAWLGVLVLMGPAASAQDGLAGTWEAISDVESGAFVSRLVLDSDGGARMSVTGRLNDEFLASESEAGGAVADADSLTVSFVGSGTWTTSGDLLVLALAERELRVNDAAFEAFIDELGERLAASLAADLEIPEQDISALTATIQAALHAQLDEEALLADLISGLAGGTRYELAWDQLRLDDGEGGTDVWTRVQQTAVEAAIWATVKTNPGRGQRWTR